MGFSFAIVLNWKKLLLTTLLTCLVKIKEESKKTQRFLTSLWQFAERDPSAFFKLDTSFGGPKMMMSVLLSLSWRTFVAIQLLMSLRQLKIFSKEQMPSVLTGR